MAEQKTITLPNPDDVVTLLNASVETIKKVSAAVIKLSSIDVESFIKSEKNLKKIIPGVQNFTTQIIDIIKMLSDDAILKGNEDELAKLFIDANTYLLNKDGSIKLDENRQKTIIKNGFTIPSIIAAVASSITNMSKSMNELSNIGLDITSSIKFKISIMLFKEQLRGVIDTIADILDDETIKKTLFNSKTNLQGTISVFERLNDLFKVIETYSNTKNILTIKLASIITYRLYKKDGRKKATGFLVHVSNMLLSVEWMSLKDRKRQKEIDDINKVFKGLVKIFESIQEICVQLITIGALYLFAKIGIKASIYLAYNIQRLVGHLNHVSLEIKSQNTSKSINEISIILGGLVKICKDASIIALLFLPAMLGIWASQYLLKGVSKLIKIINKYAFEIRKTDVSKNVMEIILVMGAIAGLCAISALTGLLVLKAWDLIFYGFLAITGMLLAIIGIMWILSHDSFQKMTVQSSLSMLLLTAVLASLSIVVMLTALVGAIALEHSDEMLRGLLVMGIAIVILLGVFFLVNLASPVIIVGAIAMLILVGAILVLEIAVMLLVVMVNVLNTLKSGEIASALRKLKLLLLGSKKTDGLISVLCGCAWHIVEILSAMVVLAMITAVSVMLTTVIVLFMANAKMLRTLGKEGITEASANIKSMINSFIDAVDIFSGKGIGGSAKLMVKISGALVAFTQLMIIAGCIAAMASVIQHIAELDMMEFDENGHPTGKRVKMSSEDIMDAAANATLISSFFVKLVSPGQHTIKTSKMAVSFTGLNLDELKNVSLSTTAKMVELNIIVSSIGRMAETVQKVASLSIPTGFDKDGNPTGYKQMEEGDFIKAATNIGKIALLFVSSLANPIEIKDENGNDITGGKSILDYVSEFSRKETNRLKAVFSIGDSLSNMVNAVIAVSSQMEGVQLTGEGSVKQTLTRVVSMMMNCGLEYVDSQGHYQPIVDVISQVNKNWTGIGKAGGLVNSIINDFIDKKINVEDHKKFINENIKFIDKANSIDVEKIRTVTSMFGQMTEFSKSLNGNIEDLAKVLSEDLVDALNELNGIMKGTSENAEKATALGTSMKQDSKVPTTTTSSNSQAQTSQKVDLSGVESKLQDIITKLSKINTNIEDLQ